MQVESTFDCGKRPEEIHALVLGELERSRAWSLRSHMVVCPSCQQAYEDATALDEALQQLSSLNCPPRLMSELHSISRPRLRLHSQPWLVRGIGLAAAAVLLSFVAHRCTLRPPAPAPPIASAPDLEVAERQVELALGLLNAAGRESARRASEKVLEIGLVAPARRLGTVLRFPFP